MDAKIGRQLLKHLLHLGHKAGPRQQVVEGQYELVRRYARIVGQGHLQVIPTIHRDQQAARWEPHAQQLGHQHGPKLILAQVYHVRIMLGITPDL